MPDVVVVAPQALRRGIDKLHQAAGLEGTRWVTHQTTAVSFPRHAVTADCPPDSDECPQHRMAQRTPHYGGHTHALPCLISLLFWILSKGLI